MDLNASRAARDVGYAPKSASVEGSRLLANVEVQAELTRQWAILMEQSNVTPEKIVAELAAIAFADLGDYVRIVRGEPVLDMSEMSTGATLALVGRQQKWVRLAFGTRCLLPVLEWDPRRFGSCFLAFGEFVRCPIQPYTDRIVFRFGPSQRLARALERPGPKYQLTGGRLSAQGRASSRAAEAASTVTSSFMSPMICRPIGSPADEKPAGTDAAGLPVRLNR